MASVNPGPAHSRGWSHVAEGGGRLQYSKDSSRRGDRCCREELLCDVSHCVTFTCQQEPTSRPTGTPGAARGRFHEQIPSGPPARFGDDAAAYRVIPGPPHRGGHPVPRGMPEAPGRTAFLEKRTRGRPGSPVSGEWAQPGCGGAPRGSGSHGPSPRSPARREHVSQARATPASHALGAGPMQRQQSTSVPSARTPLGLALGGRGLEPELLPASQWCVARS